MDRHGLHVGARLVATGFAILAFAGFDDLISQDSVVVSGGARLSAQWLLSVVAPLLSLAGWWFLTQIEPRDERQRSHLTTAYWLLGLQYLVLFASQLLRAPSFSFLQRLSSFWLTSAAFGVIAIGFTAVARAIRDFTGVPRTTSTTSYWRRPSRILIFTGFAVMALASLVTLRDALASHYYTFADPRGALQLFTPPLASLFAAAAWWLLCHFDAATRLQQSTLARAYLWFGLATGVGTVQQVISISQISAVTRAPGELWLNAAGSLIATIGFILASRQAADAPSLRGALT